MIFKLLIKEHKAVQAKLKQTGKYVLRARTSAIKSTGWLVQQSMRNYIEYGGWNWADLHPLSMRFYKKRNEPEGRWVLRRRKAHQTPYFFLGKFVRYLTASDGSEVEISVGKSRRGQPGSRDRELEAILMRAESGETIHVTDAMRRKFGATHQKRPRRQQIGVHFFPLRKSTTTLTIPPRPVVKPVFRDMAPKKIPIHFATKFEAALRRYQEQGKSA